MQVTLNIPDDTLTDAINEKVQSVKMVDLFPDVMDKGTTAKFLHCSRNTLDIWIKQNGLPVIRIGNNYRFIKSDVLNWLKSQGN